MSRAIFAREQIDETHGLETHTPKAELTGKMVYMFLTGMVKDKIGYTIREICKNAWEVGEFEVGLPTDSSPVFRVRDYGPGLSHHFMTHRYPKLGDSTKDADGVDGMSGWGAGSKSPLAYLMEDGLGGAFTVTSYQKGIARFYSINLNAESKPQVTFMGEGETDERDGLEVSVPVRTADFRMFHSRARDILWSFNPQPRITPDLGWKTPVIVSSGKGWTLYDKNSVPFYGPQVRTGCVMYPIRLRSLEGLSGFVTEDDAVVFDIEPAMIEVTSSREDLQYTTATKKTLVELLGTYEQSFVVDLQEKISEAESYFDACRVFRDQTSPLGFQRKNALQPKVTWRGLPIRSNLDFLREQEIGKVMYLSNGWSAEFTDRFDGGGTIHPENLVGVKIAIEHVPFRSFERMRVLGGLIGQKLLWVRVKRANKDLFMQEFGLTDDDVVILDDAKIELSASRSRAGRPKTVRVRRVIEGSRDYRDDVDMAAGGLFVRKIFSGRRSERFSLGGDYTHGQSLSQIQNLVVSMVSLGIIEEPLRIMVPNADEELNEEWTEAGPYIEDLLRSRLNLAELDFTPQLNVYQIPSDLRTKVIERGAFSFANGPEDLVAFQNDARALYSELSNRAAQPPSNNRKIYDLLISFTTVELPEREKPYNPINALADRWNALQLKYPLLPIIMSHGWYIRQDHHQNMKHYLDLLRAKERVEALATQSLEEAA